MIIMTTIQPDRSRRLTWRALALPLLLAAAGTAPLGDPVPERQVKAAFLYKFLGYAEFPVAAFADAATPLTIAVVGSDGIASELMRIAAGRLIGSRSVAVRQLREHETLAPVHLLFIAGADCARASRVLRAVQGTVLTVTECEGGLGHGSVINFRIIDDRVRFEVSLDAAESNHVKLSSRLLTVAHRVQKAGA
jgi:hypothetical protein